MSSATLLNTPLYRLVEKCTGFELSPAQRALLAIGTGQRVQDLRGDVREAAERALGYSEGPDHPTRVLYANCGARGGKTMLAAYLAAHRALVCDLSGMAPGEECRVGFVSASMQQARHGLRYARGLVKAAGLERLLRSDRRDSFSLVREGGRTVEFAVIRAGSDGLHGFWYPALAIHEAALAVDPSANGVALDLEAVLKSVRPRLLPPRGNALGGICVLESTAWETNGLAHTIVTENQGKADAKIVIFTARTDELRPNDKALHELIESERQTDPFNAERTYDVVWSSAGASGGFVFGPELIDRAVVDAMPTDLTPEPNLEAWAGVDLAFTGDGSALAIVRKRPSGDFELAALRRWKPRRGAPLRPSEVIGVVLDEAERHGVRMVFADVHHREQLSEAAQGRRRIRIVDAPPGAGGKERTHADAQELIASGTFKMGRDHHLLRSLSRITATRTPDGHVRIRSPRRKGDHGDDSSALVLALHAVHRWGGRGRDPIYQGGRISLTQQNFGLVDAQGRRIAPSAATEFGISADGRAYARPGRRVSLWGNPRRQFGGGDGGF